MNIKDTQNSAEHRDVTIERVGIKKIRHPISVLQRNQHIQHTIALCDLAVKLPATKRGVHMSRLIGLINDLQQPLTPVLLTTLLKDMLIHQHAIEGTIVLEFPFFMHKNAPISQQASLMDYHVTLRAECNAHTEIGFTIVVPVKNLCPASKEISIYGAHNQRSYISISSSWAENTWLEDVIELVEAQASAPLYSLLKRVDEKYITEYAYEHPKFVEDVVRDIALSLDRDGRFAHYTVEAENIESIHNHSAYAWVKK